MITNWNQIDGWVQRNYSNPLLDKETFYKASEDDSVKPFRSAFQIPNLTERRREEISLMAKSKEIYENKWQSVKTTGDGTCLLHALLLSTSRTYRRIPLADRSAVGIAFRQGPILEMFSGIDDTGIPYPKNHILSKEFIRTPYNFLQNEHIQILSQKLNLNFYIIVKERQSVDGVQNYMSPGSPWIFILCRNPNHYSSIYLGSQRKFLLTDKEFMQLYPNINKESIEYLLKLPIYHLINSSEENSKYHVRTDLLSTPIEVLEGKLDLYSKSLKINRGLLEDAYRNTQKLRGNINTIVKMRANIRREEMNKALDNLGNTLSRLPSSSIPPAANYSSIPPTATSSSIPPTATSSSIPPTATSSSTAPPLLFAHIKMKEYLISKSISTYQRAIKKILNTEVSENLLNTCDMLAGLNKGTLVALYNKTKGTTQDKKNVIISKIKEQLNTELDEIENMDFTKIYSKNIKGIIENYNKLLKNIQAGGTRKNKKSKRKTRSSRKK